MTADEKSTHNKLLTLQCHRPQMALFRFEVVCKKRHFCLQEARIDAERTKNWHQKALKASFFNMQMMKRDNILYTFQ